MTVAVTLAGGNKFVTLMCCSDDVILGIGIGYWYRWRPIVLGIEYASWYRSNPTLDLSEMPHAPDARHSAHSHIFAQLNQNISINRLKFKDFSSNFKYICFQALSRALNF